MFILFYVFLSFAVLLDSLSAAQLNIVGWWVGGIEDPEFPIEKFDWSTYTHIRYGGPSSYPNGTVYCNKTDYQFQRVLELAHKHKVKLQWSPGIPDIHDVLWNPRKNQFRNNYLNSIGHAVHTCNVDGVEVDYEFQDSKYMKLGIVTPGESTHYSQFLADIKKSLGSTKIVSADVSIWGIAPGNYLLGVLPWINATMLNRGDFDFINTMSYHWDKDGKIWAWEKDALFIDLWGIDRKRVHIGIPFFSENRTKDLKIFNEPIWRSLSPSCPNINSEINVCDRITFVGKEMNYKLGRWIKQQGFGGVFPWAANYDSIQFNNSLVMWLKKGLASV